LTVRKVLVWPVNFSAALAMPLKIDDANDATGGSSPGGVNAELKATTTIRIRDAAIGRRPDWHAVERVVREYVTVLKAQGLKPERAIIEAKTRVVQATGDPSHHLLPSVETWTLSVYYDR
jgi:hypothetical protein